MERPRGAKPGSNHTCGSVRFVHTVADGPRWLLPSRPRRWSIDSPASSDVPTALTNALNRFKPSVTFLCQAPPLADSPQPPHSKEKRAQKNLADHFPEVDKIEVDTRKPAPAGLLFFRKAYPEPPSVSSGHAAAASLITSAETISYRFPQWNESVTDSSAICSNNSRCNNELQATRMK
jgi:hypothetical protein